MIERIPSPPLNYDYSVITADTDHVATLLLDAKNEYHKQLTNHLRQPIFNIMKTIYNSSENICHQENTPENVLMVFQDNLAQVPKWNKQRRTKEYDEFLKITKCEWFNELIKFTYVTHVKILTIVNKSRPGVKLSISIPSGGTFFHSVCITVARELWKAPYLFSKHVGGKYEYQKNIRAVEQIIDNSVDSCIREHIPMKAILQDYLDGDISEPDAKPPAILTKQSVNQNKPVVENLKTEAGTNTDTEADDQDNKRNKTNKSPIKLSKPHVKSIVSDESIDEFLNEDEPFSNEKSNDNSEIKLDDLETDLEPIDFNSPDEIVEELEMIESSISNHHQDLNTMDNSSIDLSEVSLNDIPETKKSESINPESINPDAATPESSKMEDSTMNPDASKMEDSKNDKITDIIKTNEDLASETTKITADQIIEEFDIDSIPDIDLKTAVITPEDNSETAATLTAVENAVQEIEDTTVPITDLNEPGLEFKPPQVKKKLIVNDLMDDDLEEVNLETQAEEIRAIKKPASRNPTQPTVRKEFTFFS